MSSTSRRSARVSATTSAASHDTRPIVAAVSEAIARSIRNDRREASSSAAAQAPADAVAAQDAPLPPPAPVTDALKAARPKRASNSKAKAKAAVAEPKEEEDDTEEQVQVSQALQSVEAPKKRGKGKGKAVAAKEEEEEEDAAEAPKKRTRKRKAAVDENGDADEAGEPSKKPRKKRASKAKAEEGTPSPPPEPWVPPPVQHRSFEAEGPATRGPFTGRLGYACLNTVLRNAKPPVFCSRTLRIKTIEEKGMDYVKELARANVKDLIPMLKWNAANKIHFMRLSCEMMPFASHPVYGWDVAELATELKEAGDLAKELGIRLTTHPGQFVVLSTPREEVLTASIAEFEMYCKVMDLMGLPKDSIMILHGGGTYGDQAASLLRIEDTIVNKLSASARSRLVLENDELSYSAEDLLPLCERLDVPLVFDFHHDLLRPSSLSPAELMPRILAIFKKRGITPKFHLSEPRHGAMTQRDRRAHSDRCTELPYDLPADADLMIEAKDKEQSVLEMYRIYQLHPVDVASLRPAADDQTVRTGGRRTKLDGSGGSTSALKKDGSPRKKTAKQETQEKIAKAIAKAKEVAARMGVEYTGPKTQDEIETERGEEMTGVQVLRDMHVTAERIRADLKAGKERKPYDATEEGQEDVVPVNDEEH